MATLSDPTKRRTSIKKNTNSIKALIMAASVAITLGGWGILATEQAQSAQASAQSAPASLSVANSATTSSASSNSSTRIRQSNASTAPVQAVARTRSSR